MAEPEPWLDGVEPRFREPLRRCAAGLPANVALMQLLAQCLSAEEAEVALASAISSLDRQGDTAAARLGAAAALLRANPRAFEIVRSILDEVDHERRAESPDDALALCAAAFDRAAQSHPEGSVALYSLGDPALLDAATEDVVAQLQAWGLLSPDSLCLDIGCGIGRFEIALAPRVRRITGVDISAAMVEAAQDRCAHLANVEIRQTSGRDLSPFAAASFDLVLAVDSFPYLVQAAGDLAATMITEAARVLRPGGHLAILNYSYRGAPEADRHDLAAHGGRNGLQLVQVGLAGLKLWDATAFVLVKS